MGPAGRPLQHGSDVPPWTAPVIRTQRCKVRGMLAAVGQVTVVDGLVYETA